MNIKNGNAGAHVRVENAYAKIKMLESTSDSSLPSYSYNGSHIDTDESLHTDSRMVIGKERARTLQELPHQIKLAF